MASRRPIWGPMARQKPKRNRPLRSATGGFESAKGASHEIRFPETVERFYLAAYLLPPNRNTHAWQSSLFLVRDRRSRHPVQCAETPATYNNGRTTTLGTRPSRKLGSAMDVHYDRPYGKNPQVTENPRCSFRLVTALGLSPVLQAGTARLDVTYCAHSDILQPNRFCAPRVEQQ